MDNNKGNNRDFILTFTEEGVHLIPGPSSTHIEIPWSSWASVQERIDMVRRTFWNKYMSGFDADKLRISDLLKEPPKNNE